MNSYKYPAFMSTKNKNSETLLLRPNPCYHENICTIVFIIFQRQT